MVNKISLIDLASSQASSIVAAVNANNVALGTAMDKTLSRDGTGPNTMAAILDMNSNRVINLPLPTSASEPMRKGEFDSFLFSYTNKSNIVGTVVPISVSGDANNPVFSAPKAVQLYTTPQIFLVTPVLTNTTSMTFTLDIGSGVNFAVPWKQLDGVTDLLPGDCQAGLPYFVLATNTVVRMLSPGSVNSIIINNVTNLNAAFTRLSQTADANDFETDRLAPFFINTWEYTKSFVYPSAFASATVSTRDSATQFTLSVGGGANFAANTAVVVYNGTYYTSFRIKSVVGDVVTVYDGPLPATLTSAQTMQDSAFGQHLTAFGYNGLADFIVSQVQKYAYRKANLLFYYHPPITMGIAYNDTKVYALDGTTILFTPTVLGTAAGGGLVSGTSDLGKVCQAQQVNEGITSFPFASYLARNYIIQDATAGNGISFTFNVDGMSGFLEIPVSAAAVLYNAGANTTSGGVTLQVLGDSTTLLNQTYSVGQTAYPRIDFAKYKTITVNVSLASSVPSSIRLHGIYAWGKSAETPKTGLFRDGDVVAFLGDSWTQKPDGTGLTRPDGSTGDGLQYLSERLRTNLAASSIKVTTLNMGHSSQTSEWGKFWVSKILALTPKPTHCVVCFFVNDVNSTAHGADTVDTAYDFDPTAMFTAKLQSIGGRRGSVTNVNWFKNIKYICDTLVGAGIKPIVIMPGHTGANGQTQVIQQNQLAKLVLGFRDINALGGGA